MSGTQAILEDELEAVRESFFAVWRAALAWAYARQVRRGHTLEVMAERLGWSVDKLRRLMAVPRTLKLDQLAEICWAMHCEPTLDMIDGRVAVCITPVPGLSPAQADTHPQGGDSLEAPFMSDTVGEADAPVPSGDHHQATKSLSETITGGSNG